MRRLECNLVRFGELKVRDCERRLNAMKIATYDNAFYFDFTPSKHRPEYSALAIIISIRRCQTR